MRRKKEPEQETSAGAARLSPADVQQVEFRLAFRGYNERDVDAFLDRVTEDLAAYVDENERLRAGAGIDAGAPISGDTDTATREAESIVARAREEAAAIVRRAEQQVAAIDAATRGDARSAVAPFLNTEREFLQSLGSLVQSHAEEIKQMVLSLKERAPEDAAASGAPGAAAGDRTNEGSGETETGRSAAEVRERLSESEPEEADSPVVIESATEPAYSSEGVPAKESRERSLRDLFWGDES